VERQPSATISLLTGWRDFAAAEPALAGRVRALLEAQKHMTLATLRRDGSQATARQSRHRW